MTNQQVIKAIASAHNITTIKNISIDSRFVKRGDLFCALKGEQFNGENFIKEAIAKGAKAVVCSKKIKIKSSKIPIIKTNNVREQLANICKKFYNEKPKNIFAVTGTNGKSSVADFFYQILSFNKMPVASIGTLGIKKNGKIKKLKLTSPDIITLHKELQLIKKKGNRQCNNRSF